MSGLSIKLLNFFENGILNLTDDITIDSLTSASIFSNSDVISKYDTDTPNGLLDRSEMEKALNDLKSIQSALKSENNEELLNIFVGDDFVKNSGLTTEEILNKIDSNHNGHLDSSDLNYLANLSKDENGSESDSTISQKDVDTLKQTKETNTQNTQGTDGQNSSGKAGGSGGAGNTDSATPSNSNSVVDPAIQDNPEDQPIDKQIDIAQNNVNEATKHLTDTRTSQNEIINTSENDLNKAIQESAELKGENEVLKKTYDTNNTQLTTINNTLTTEKNELTSDQSEQASLNSAISGLTAEKSQLEASMGQLENKSNKNTNGQNGTKEDNNNDIEKQISEIKAKINTIQSEINEKNNRLNELKPIITKLSEQIPKDEATKTTCEATKTDLQNKISAILPADSALKTKITESQKAVEAANGTITKAEQDDNAIITENSEKLKTLRPQQGNTQGAAEGLVINSGATELGGEILDLAIQYLGKNEADGSYKMFTEGRGEWWCADFVSYVVKEAYAKLGKDVPDGFGSNQVEQLQKWAIANGCYIDSNSADDKVTYIKENVRPGDVIIFKQNGRSHTGLVESIDPDGTIHTIEGNTDTDDVARRQYKADEASLSGFISLP